MTSILPKSAKKAREIFVKEILFLTMGDGEVFKLHRITFANFERSSSITGIDYNFIERFAAVLEAISSGYGNNYWKMPTCSNTAKLFLWMLSVIIEHALLPIGTQPGKAAEGQHSRQYRQSFLRKFSWVQCTTDVLNRLLLTSDTYLSKTLKPFRLL